jgi:hypothetical protein
VQTFPAKIVNPIPDAFGASIARLFDHFTAPEQTRCVCSTVRSGANAQAATKRVVFYKPKTVEKSTLS